VGKKNRTKKYAPTHENGYCRTKMNQYNFNKYKSPDILTVIEIRKLQ